MTRPAAVPSVGSPPTGRPPRDRPVRGHRGPGPAQAPSRPLPPVPGRALPSAGSSATSLEELDDDGYPPSPARLRRVRPRRVTDDHWESSGAASATSRSAGAAGLATAVERSRRVGGEPRRLHYLSIPPHAADAVVRTLGEAGLTDRSRIIMEKPFGTDLHSARRLNGVVHEVFDDEQVFRIDHFLGKEAAQNILAFRFANGLFEPIWNREHIDHIQIDVPETLRSGAGRVLRADRCVPGHGGHPPVPDPGLRGHGAPDRPRAPRHQRGEEQGVPVHAADRHRPRRAGPVRGVPLPKGWPPTPTPRPSSPCAARSTTGGGPASRSSCAPESTWPKGPRIVSIAFREPPSRCSRRARASAPRVPTTSPSTWPTRPSCRCPSTASGRARA